jgi:hypothetical protein
MMWVGGRPSRRKEQFMCIKGYICGLGGFLGLIRETMNGG